MKTICLYSVMSLLAASSAFADAGVQRLASGATVRDVEISKERDSVVIAMDIDLSGMEVGRNRSVVVAPLFYAGEEWKWLPAIEVMGRTRYLYYQRNEESLYTEQPYSIVRHKKEEAQTVNYRIALPYASWMDCAELAITEDACGCGEVEKGSRTALAQADLVFTPRLAYITPQAETRKARSLSGEAFLDFPVNRTEIHPDYRRNAAELRKIRSTIDTIRADKDFSVTQIMLKGYASPEGSQTSNQRLAEGRTNALKEYLVNEYGIDAKLFRAEPGGENWEGLRKYVEESDLADKDAILTLMDGEGDIDQKERNIRSRYPEAYRTLLADCYPALRRTDYTVSYTIRGFNVNEAKEIIKTRPQNLSLQEMFAVAQTYEPGSEDFNRVFDVAVRMYPDDETANLNAANALLERREAEQALKYLEKAGDSPQADNARGVALILLERYDEAKPCLERAAQAGIREAEENLEASPMRVYQNKKTTIKK